MTNARHPNNESRTTEPPTCARVADESEAFAVGMGSSLTVPLWVREPTPRLDMADETRLGVRRCDLRSVSAPRPTDGNANRGAAKVDAAARKKNTYSGVAASQKELKPSQRDRAGSSKPFQRYN